MNALYGFAALLAEVALLVAWALGIYGWVDGVVGAILAVLAVVSVGVIWGVLLAPRASRPLPRPAASLLKLVLFAAAGALLATAGFGIFGIAVAAYGLVIVALESTIGTADERLQARVRA